jgi:hypothetical protein
MDVHGWPPSNLKERCNHCAVRASGKRELAGNLSGRLTPTTAPRRCPATAGYLFDFFFGAAFFDGVGFFAPFAADEPPRLPPKAFSQPSEYRLFGPTRVIVTAVSSPGRDESDQPRWPGASRRHE